MSDESKKCRKCGNEIPAGEEHFNMAIVHHPSKLDPRLLPVIERVLCGNCALNVIGAVSLDSKMTP